MLNKFLPEPLGGVQAPEDSWIEDRLSNLRDCADSGWPSSGDQPALLADLNFSSQFQPLPYTY